MKLEQRKFTMVALYASKQSDMTRESVAVDGSPARTDERRRVGRKRSGSEKKDEEIASQGSMGGHSTGPEYRGRKGF